LGGLCGRPGALPRRITSHAVHRRQNHLPLQSMSIARGMRVRAVASVVASARFTHGSWARWVPATAPYGGAA
jgi:hypothetical protein